MAFDILSITVPSSPVTSSGTPADYTQVLRDAILSGVQASPNLTGSGTFSIEHVTHVAHKSDKDTYIIWVTQ